MRPVDAAVRIEWAVVAVAAILAYGWLGGSWWLFALLILAPDLSMIGYLAGPRLGALSYNALHFLAFPVLLLAAGAWLASSPAEHLAVIWLAHIAVDRALGYGLKRATGFQDTHMGRIGRAANP
jgi:hypothetical protein